jgi:broad specificity phosphatase PhoE
MTSQTVYLIRHAQVNGNVLDLNQRIQVCEFNALIAQIPYEAINEAGRLQAEAIAAQIADYRLTCLFTSPLLRAQQTARILAEAAGIPLIVRPDLYEILPATLRGQPTHRYSLRGAYFRSGIRLSLPWTRDTETLWGAYRRVRRAWQEMTAEVKTDFGIVGHQGLFRLLMLDLRLARHWLIVKNDTRNMGISIIRRRD